MLVGEVPVKVVAIVTIVATLEQPPPPFSLKLAKLQKWYLA
jgi:hypothetical protein